MEKYLVTYFYDNGLPRCSQIKTLIPYEMFLDIKELKHKKYDLELLIADKKTPNKEPLKAELSLVKKELKTKYDFQYFIKKSSLYEAVHTGILKMNIGNTKYEFKIDIRLWK